MQNPRTSEARSYPAHPKVVAAGRDAICALGDADFTPTPHLDFTRDLANRLALDLSTTLAVMERLPLWQSGTDHTSLRREVASFLSENRKEKNKAASERVRLCFESYLDATDIDLLAAIRDVVHIFMEEVTGLPLISGISSDMPSVFSSNLGIRSRKRLESCLRMQMEFARKHFPHESESRHLLRVGQWTMGRDALIGTIGLSLYHHLTLLDGRPLNTIRLSIIPTHTGIPAIGRIAQKDLSVAGCPVSKGALIECRLDTLANQPENDRRHFFGAGAHLCLGRPLTLSLMTMIADFLLQHDFGLQTYNFHLAENDVFDIPGAFNALKITDSQAECCS